MNLCTPLKAKNSDGILRVIMPSRISTPGQDAENMEARQDEVEAWVRRNYQGEVKALRLGEQASGWLPNRPTMIEATEAVESGEYDAVVVSELREIYRNPQFQWAFLQTCVDAEVRVIVLNDAIDTSDENWEVIAHTAVLRHGMFVPETRRRVRTNAAHAFEKGGMVLRNRFGYRKLTKEEAASGKFGAMGLRIIRITEATEIIKEMGRRVVAGHSPDAVAEWLNAEGILPGPYVKSQRWTGRLVETLLRDPILTGWRRRRMVLYTQVYHGKKPRRTRNPDPQVKHWDDLAHLTVEEQNSIIAAFDARGRDDPQPSGPDHPLWRRPKAWSIWPGQHARCICGGSMYRYGQFLRCANVVRNGPKTCWNHVQVNFAHVYAKVLPWILEVIDQHPPCREKIVEFAWNEMERLRLKASGAEQDLDRRIAQLCQEAKNITKAIRSGGELKSLVATLAANEKETEDLHRQRHQLTANQSGDDFLSKEDVAANLPRAFDRLARESFQFAKLLRRLIPEFTIIPVQALDNGFVRPRARLKLSLAAWCKEGDPCFSATTEIDLFDPPLHITWMPRCVELKRANPSMGLRKIANELGINYITVKRALAYARLMEANGLTEPYRTLEKRPAEASRWKKRAG